MRKICTSKKSNDSTAKSSSWRSRISAFQMTPNLYQMRNNGLENISNFQELMMKKIMNSNSDISRADEKGQRGQIALGEY